MVPPEDITSVNIHLSTAGVTKGFIKKTLKYLETFFPFAEREMIMRQRVLSIFGTPTVTTSLLILCHCIALDTTIQVIVWYHPPNPYNRPCFAPEAWRVVNI